MGTIPAMEDMVVDFWLTGGQAAVLEEMVVMIVQELLDALS